MSPKPTTPALARGMRDLLPTEARRRRWVCEQLADLFESFGYAPLETPAVELESTLMGKYGPDAERLLFRAGLAGEGGYALRYDLSVPLARVAASHGNLPKPFRRYQIAPVWRGERPQRGRYREFIQADFDLLGSPSVAADAEIIQIVVEGLQRLGLPRTVTKLNDRRVLNGIGRFAGVPDSLLPGLYRAIDKLDKVGQAGVRLELMAVGLSGDLLNRQRQAVERWHQGKADLAQLATDLSKSDDEGQPAASAAGCEAFLAVLRDTAPGTGKVADLRQAAIAASLHAQRRQAAADRLIPEAAIDRLLGLLAVSGSGEALLDDLDARLEDDEARVGTASLRQVLRILSAVGIGEDRVALDFSMVRGLAYYNGSIFETVVPEPPIGSVSGGGRYDGLVGIFGRQVTAVGSSLGVDRLVDVMVDLGLFGSRADGPPLAYVVAFGDEDAPRAAALARSMRRGGVATVVSTESQQGLGQQLRSADQLGCRWALIEGSDEQARAEVGVKDLRTGQQQAVARSTLADWLQASAASAATDEAAP